MYIDKRTCRNPISQPDKFALYKSVIETVLHRHNLLRDHVDIHEANAWISPTLQTAILAVDNFPRIVGGPARVEADLKAQWGIP